MCQSLAEGGKRCSEASQYGHALRNVKAKEQYWVRKYAQSDETEKEKIEKHVAQAQAEVEKLKQAKELYGEHVTPQDIAMTPAGQKVIDALYDAGLNPLVVGGSVRDRLLGLSSKDLDIEVYGGETQTVLQALRKVGKVDEVGKSFGVLKIVVDGEDMDISLPRTDNKLGEGHRGFEISVDPYLTPARASQRRDFTINSMLYDTKLNVIVDPNNGLNDLKNKTLTHVSDAFDEDPLRVLRGVQMSSRFGFTISDETAEKSKTLRKEFSTLSNERVRIEFNKLYTKGKSSRLALQTLKKTGWDECFPGLAQVNNHDLARQMQRVDNDKKLNNTQKQVFYSALIAEKLNSKDAENFLQKTVNNDADRSSARNLINIQQPTKLNKTVMRRWAHQVGKGTSIKDWCDYQEYLGNERAAKIVRAKAKKLNLLDKPDPDFVKGQDIIDIFPNKKTGIWVGKVAQLARARQEEDVFRSNEDGVAWIRKNIREEDLESMNKR